MIRWKMACCVLLIPLCGRDWVCMSHVAQCIYCTCKALVGQDRPKAAPYTDKHIVALHELCSYVKAFAAISVMIFYLESAISYVEVQNHAQAHYLVITSQPVVSQQRPVVYCVRSAVDKDCSVLYLENLDAMFHRG